jgi:hypothetical protein
MAGDDSQYKQVPLGLLSTNVAREDSLRLLLITALLDEVFDDGLSTWHDLLRLRPPPQACRVRISVRNSYGMDVHFINI